MDSPSQLPHQDRLELHGTQQVDSAIAALSMTGLNPEAQEALRTQRAFYTMQQELSPGQPRPLLMVSFEGAASQAVRSDIVSGAEQAIGNVFLSRQARAAAKSLLDILVSDEKQQC